jgi:hypothetical protein
MPSVRARAHGSPSRLASAGGENSLFVIGPRAAPNDQSRVLGQLVDSVNTRQATPFVFNRELDSPTHPERPFMRSDHFNYAKKGIPVVFFTTGLHPGYHRVGDEPAKISYWKLARAAALMRRRRGSGESLYAAALIPRGPAGVELVPGQSGFLFRHRSQPRTRGA